MRHRYVFSGSGGQGMISAAVILAEAAVTYQGLNAVQTQSYGPEARGGAARADTILSDQEIRFPKVIQPDVLVCLTQEAYNRYSGIIRAGGILVTDSHLVRQSPHVDARQYGLDLHQACLESLGSSLGMNIMVLGALSKLVGIVELKSLDKIVADRYAGRHREANAKALRLGFDLAASLPPR